MAINFDQLKAKTNAEVSFKIFKFFFSFGSPSKRVIWAMGHSELNRVYSLEIDIKLGCFCGFFPINRKSNFAKKTNF